MVISGGQHLSAFGFIASRHDYHVGNAGQVRQIKRAIVRSTVGTDQATSVNCKCHIQILQGDIVDELIVSALQEGRINRDDWLESFTSKPGRVGQGVLFGNADIEITRRKLFSKLHQAGAFTHRGGDTHQATVGGGHIAKPGAKDLGVG